MFARHPAGDAMLGDLIEDYHAVAASRGPGPARRWFRWHAFRLATSIVWSLGRRSFARSLSSAETQDMIEAITPTGLLTDARYAMRALRHDLGLVVFSILVTALGVGATTAVFSILSPLLVKPLPFDEPDRLVWIANDGVGGRSAVTSRTSNLRDFRRLSTSFDGLAGYNAFFEQTSYALTGDGEPERLAGVGVTDDFLDVLGVEPLIGRDFNAAEGALWDDGAIMLSYSFWQRRFGGDTDIAGRTLTINGKPSTVIGVLPPSFDFASIFSPATRVDLLTTFPVNDETDRWGNTVSIVGRLAPDATLDSGRAEIALILDQLRQEDPERWGLSAKVTAMTEQIAGDHRSALLLLLAAAGSVLLIVCVNLTSLLLSKGIHRKREMFLRAALGAPRGRLLRQLLIESMALAAGGALLGVTLAVVITGAVASSSAVTLPLLAHVRVDSWALAFACLVATSTGLAVGLLPALQASGAGSAQGLRADGRTLTASKRSQRLREALVVAEIALACALVVTGGLLLRSFSEILDVDLGFEPTHLAAWLIDTPDRFEEAAERTAFFDSVTEAVRAVPGVTSVALTDAIPLGINRQWGIGVPGRTFEKGEIPNIYPHIVDRHYLDTMGIPLIAGRGFDSGDTADDQGVAILNETAAKTLFQGDDPLGRTITIGDTEISVIGVAADVKHLALEQGAGLELYLSMVQVPDYGTLDLVVRSELPLDSIRGDVKAAIRGIAPTVPTDDVRTLDSVVDRAVSPRRFTLQVLGAFAITALLLAAVGIYGVLSYAVSERAREIAIRMALGESTAQVRGRVLGRTLVLTAI
ncbi:MAG: ABC transporter permease, partial [Acidobacteriota bacterium]